MQLYEGDSYRNMYDTEEYNSLIERQKYVLDEKYFSEREITELPEGYILETAVYGAGRKKSFCNQGGIG